jgi:pyrophosphate--fructose-6-phosphate 1-phosphotransferase
MEMKRRASLGVAIATPASAIKDVSYSSFVPRAPLQNERVLYHPEVPSIMRGLLDPHTFPIPSISAREVPSLDSVSASHDPNLEVKLRALFPTNFGQSAMEFSKPDTGSPRSFKSMSLRIGVVLSGGQAPGGHNVICGISDVLQSSCNSDSQLLGFLDGPIGLMKGKYIDLKPEYVNNFRNQGGFHMIGSGRDKIETPEQFAAARDVCEKLCLDGVVIIGGDDSNTNAAVLSEYLKSSGSSTRVIGCPKTIDGDLKTPMIETSFGFDTACKVYSEQISNLHSDALSSGKYYHFMRLMGRAASHITLECALQTHPNIALIGEEVAAKGSTLAFITQQICDVICARAANNKHYGR